MSVFTVRADYGRYTEAFRQGGYVAIGWFDALLDNTSSREAIRARYRDDFTGHSVVYSWSKRRADLYALYASLASGSVVSGEKGVFTS